ncbi:MAG TPA: exopolysaccharide biosynthesis protein, partial [Candidatus Limnocylindrales bacterium]|nr:exopolysaccharide biosynthesis protein [Candidatus Limnocylindrales bacterium]
MYKLSERITMLVSSHAEHGVTLGQLLEKMDRQSIGFLFTLFSLPLLVPLPPGIGSPFGILLLIWSFQRLV